MDITELPPGPNGRRWSVTGGFVIPLPIVHLARHHGIWDSETATINLPEDTAHPFWDDLEALGDH